MQAIIQRLRKRQGDRCPYCGQRMIFNPTMKDDPRYRTVDHVIPIEWGGTWDLDNLTLCCRQCNESSGDEYVVSDLLMPESA